MNARVDKIMVEFDERSEKGGRVYAAIEIARALARSEAEVERLQHFIDCADTPLMRDVLAERDRLAEALHYYAEPETYRQIGWSDDIFAVVEEDSGAKAREALAGLADRNDTES